MLLLAGVPALAQATNWCNANTRYNEVRVELQGCSKPSPDELKLLYVDGRVTHPFAAVKKDGSFTTKFKTDAPLGRPQVCATTCGIARVCRTAEPEADETRKVCIAVFTLSCDTGWQLHVDSQPASAFRYSRNEALPQPAREGELVVPGDLCDVGIRERLSIHILYGGVFIGAVPISFDALRTRSIRLDGRKIRDLATKSPGELLTAAGVGAGKYLDAAKAKALKELKAKDYVAFELKK